MRNHPQFHEKGNFRNAKVIVITMENKFAPLLKTLGLAARARKITFGTELTCDAVDCAQVNLVILSNKASPGTVKKITRCCDENNTELYLVEISPEDLAHCVGKPRPVMALGITDYNLSIAVKRSAEKIKNDSGVLHRSSERGV